MKKLSTLIYSCCAAVLAMSALASASSITDYPTFQVVRDGEVIKERKMTADEYAVYKKLKHAEKQITQVTKPLHALSKELHEKQAKLEKLKISINDDMTLAEIRLEAEKAEKYAKEVEAVMQKHEKKVRLHEVKLRSIEGDISSISKLFVETFELGEDDNLKIID